MAIAGCDMHPSQATGTQAAATSPVVVQIDSIPHTPEVNFDLNAKSIPEGFSPTNPRRVAVALRDHFQDMQKGPWETTTEHRKRLADMKSKVLYDEVTLGGGMAFRSLDVKYDPDRGTLIYASSFAVESFDSVPAFLINKEDVRVADLSPNEQSKWNYVSERNPLIGHKRAIYLATSKAQSGSRFVLEHKMPRDQAKELGRSIGVLFVGNLAPLYFLPGVEYPEADDRNLTVKAMVKFDLKGIWMVNFKTGEILTRKYTTCPISSTKCSMLGS